jgi:hypothetical protein
MESQRQYYIIDEVCKMFGFECPEHITTNPSLTRRNGGQYDIVRTVKHDGTLIFTKELLGKTIENLVNKRSYFKKLEIENAKDITYEVGLISLATVFGMVDLPVGKYPCERQRARISVKCTIVR